MPSSKGESAMAIYIVTNSQSEPRRGTRFKIEEPQGTQGALCLFEIKKRLIIGRRFDDWIIQPTRWIFVGQIAVECLGKIVLLIAI
jgi:hypothetical protein